MIIWTEDPQENQEVKVLGDLNHYLRIPRTCIVKPLIPVTQALNDHLRMK